MWNRAATSSSATQNTPKSTHDATVSPPRRSEICSFALLNSRFAQTLMPRHRFSLPCRHHADEGGFRFRSEALYTVPKCQADRPEHSPSNRCTLLEKQGFFSNRQITLRACRPIYFPRRRNRETDHRSPPFQPRRPSISERTADAEQILENVYYFLFVNPPLLKNNSLLLLKLPL